MRTFPIITAKFVALGRYAHLCASDHTPDHEWFDRFSGVPPALTFSELKIMPHHSAILRGSRWECVSNWRYLVASFLFLFFLVNIPLTPVLQIHHLGLPYALLLCFSVPSSYPALFLKLESLSPWTPPDLAEDHQLLSSAWTILGSWEGISLKLYGIHFASHFHGLL